jgi:hypothetical protein
MPDRKPDLMFFIRIMNHPAASCRESNPPRWKNSVEEYNHG